MWNPSLGGAACRLGDSAGWVSLRPKESVVEILVANEMGRQEPTLPQGEIEHHVWNVKFQESRSECRSVINEGASEERVGRIKGL